MYECHIDFETRSELDLKKVGARVYAQHHSTDIICLAYQYGSPTVKLLRPQQLLTEDWTIRLQFHIAEERPVFVAHNAAFEQAIWDEIMVKRYGYPPIPLERWKCTMAKAYYHGLPGSLDDLGTALDLPLKKDKRGKALITKLCKPNKKLGRFYEYDDCPEDFEAMYEYCVRDVEVEMLLDDVLRDLSPYEQRIWQIDQRMNQRGAYLDTSLILKMQALINEQNRRHYAEFKDLAGLAPTQRAECLKWFNSLGAKLFDLQKETVALALKRAQNPKLKRGLEIYQACSKRSLAKLPQMLARMDNRGRLCEQFQYYGAHTGRWAGRGVQLQNLARPVFDIPAVVAGIEMFVQHEVNEIL